MPNEKQNTATEYEKVVANIYQLLDKKAEIKHNEKILGLESGILRQIDISIRGKVAGHPVFVAVDCKNWNTRIDTPKVGAFISLLKDVGANKGVLISKKGFAKSAIPYAKRNGVDLCQAHDAETRDWRLELKIPVIVEEVIPLMFLNCKMRLEKEMSFPRDLRDWRVSGANIYELFKTAWNGGKTKYTPGTHTFDTQIQSPQLQSVDGINVPLESFSIEHRNLCSFYLGYVDNLPKTKAIKDITNNHIQIALNLKDIDDYKEKFTRLYDPSETIIKPMEMLKFLAVPEIEFGPGFLDIRNIPE